jgi:5-dehydro-2-deoxygluconokinase
MTERTLDLIGLGRTIFGAPAEAWFAGEMTDAAATAAMSASYARLIDMWRRRKAAA